MIEQKWLADYLAMLAETARRTGIDVSVIQRVLDTFHEVAEERAWERRTRERDVQRPRAQKERDTDND
jgi:uncharacterized protein YdaU (DUF1376 family)